MQRYIQIFKKNNIDNYNKDYYDNYLTNHQEIQKLTNIQELLFISKRTCPKCGTSIVDEALYIDGKEKIFIYKCPQCLYEFRQNMTDGEQSIKIGASI